MSTPVWKLMSVLEGLIIAGKGEAEIALGFDSGIRMDLESVSILLDGSEDYKAGTIVFTSRDEVKAIERRYDLKKVYTHYTDAEKVELLGE